MAIDNVILDFDGTLTDAWAEGEQYKVHYIRALSKKIGVPRGILRALAWEIEPVVMADPLAGLVEDGLIVAPACADPFILNKVVFDEVLKRLGLENPISGHEFGELFHECINTVEDVFMPGAKGFMDALSRDYQIAIVTNSDTERVTRKVQRLLKGEYKVPVYGNASKNKLCADMEGVPASIAIEGLGGPIYLRRHRYKETLDNLTKKGFQPDNTAVVGDIFELDLALPLHLGYRSILLKTKGAREYEMKYLKSQKNGFVAVNYDEVLEVLRR
jgi:FMN phosphatase YigB (HAD superfamily)